MYESETRETPQSEPRKKRFGRLPMPGILRKALTVPEIGILAPLIAFTLLFDSLNPRFLSASSVEALLRGLAFVGVIGVGMTFLMVVGELDLSVGSVAGLCAIVAAWLMEKAGWNVAESLIAGLCLGAVVGLINGLIAVKIGIPAFITTLGMLYIARGFNYLICSGYPIYPLPHVVNSFGEANPIGLSWSFLILVGIVLLGDFVLRRTTFGRMIYATGGNREVARISGINTSAVKIGCYMLTGTLAALGGILTMASLNVGQPDIGQGWELDVIASVVIGGVSLFGGVGTVVGSFIGLLVMQVVSTGLVMTGVRSHWQTVAVGSIMIVAVGMDLLRRRACVS